VCKDNNFDEDTLKAVKEANRLVANLRCELQPNEKANSYNFDELINFEDIDNVIVEVSAIVPANVK